jgi:hypothetical protein
MGISTRVLVGALALALGFGCADDGSGSDDQEQPHPFTTGPETPLPEVAGKTTFELMVLGDFGTGSEAEHDVDEHGR